MSQQEGTDVFSLSTTPYLPRGKACANCRLRKMKCDGARPTCGPCARAGRADCEYVATAAPSTTRALERKVTQLRGRLRELERTQGSGEAAAGAERRGSQATGETMFQTEQAASQASPSILAGTSRANAAEPSVHHTPPAAYDAMYPTYTGHTSQSAGGAPSIPENTPDLSWLDYQPLDHPIQSSGASTSTSAQGSMNNPGFASSFLDQPQSNIPAYSAAPFDTPLSSYQQPYNPPATYNPPAAFNHPTTSQPAPVPPSFGWSGYNTYAPPPPQPQQAPLQQLNRLIASTGANAARVQPRRPEAHTLMNAFLRPDVHQPLWFLHRASFLAAAALPEGHPGRAHPALVAAVAACGAAAAGARESEPELIRSALGTLNANIGQGTPAYEMLALHTIQARVLLGHMLLSRGNALHGAEVLAGACTIARILLLHVDPEGLAGPIVGGIVSARLPPSASAISAAERCGAAWVSATLERLWALARGTSPRVPLVDVAVPWPQTPEFVNSPPVAHAPPGASPHGPEFHDFLFGGTGTPPMWNGDNVMELIGTAAAIFEAASLRVSLDPTVDRQPFYNVDARNEALLVALGPAQQADPRTLPAHVLAHGTTLQLHSVVAADPLAIRSARALAGMAPLLRTPGAAPGFLEPAMMMILPAACRALLAGRSVDPSVAADADVALDSIQATLEVWAHQSAFIQVQLGRVRRERAGLR